MDSVNERLSFSFLCPRYARVPAHAHTHTHGYLLLYTHPNSVFCLQLEAFCFGSNIYSQDTVEGLERWLHD